MQVLVTGGLGFIGSHTCVSLLEAGFDVGIVDNLSNSKKVVLRHVEKIAGILPAYFEGDVRDHRFLDAVFADFKPAAVIHFAGLKSVGESIEQPATYYDNNVAGTLCLLKSMDRAGIKKLVFSSTANVYGDAAPMPVSEGSLPAPNNPYGRSKLMMEEILRDVTTSDSTWRVACLRYFNPVGAHKSGLIGENPLQIASNLMPLITDVASGIREKLDIFGQDYATPDGTGVRDFVHVLDLAESHLAALRYLDALNDSAGNFLLANVGRGKGVSVLELVTAFVRYTGVNVPYEISPRRAGDIAVSYADVSLAEKIMGWKSRFGLKDICEDAWRWQLMNVKRHRI